jgi:hypothetical protein
VWRAHRERRNSGHGSHGGHRRHGRSVRARRYGVVSRSRHSFTRRGCLGCCGRYREDAANHFTDVGRCHWTHCRRKGVGTRPDFAMQDLSFPPWLARGRDVIILQGPAFRRERVEPPAGSARTARRIALDFRGDIEVRCARDGYCNHRPRIHPLRCHEHVSCIFYVGWNTGGTELHDSISCLVRLPSVDAGRR